MFAMAPRAFFVAALALAAVAFVAAQPSTKATRFDGFTYASNVYGYVNMTVDYCDIQTAIAAGDFSTALDIYTNGKNSRRTAVSLRTFMGFATHDGGVEPLYVSLTMGRSAGWLDVMIKDAFSAGNGPLALGLIQVAGLKYMVHEIDEGSTKLGLYLEDNTLESLIADDTGAPHNVDEGFALWSGGTTAACETPSNWAAQLGDLMDTEFVGSTYINNAMTLAWNDLLAYGRNGTLDQATYNATRGNVVRYLTLLGLQGVTLGAYKAELAANCKRPAADVAAAKAMITTHWTYLEGLLNSRMGRKRIDALGAALTKSSPKFKDVRNAVKDVISGMGRRMSEVGEPDFDEVNASWKCSSASQPKRK